MTAIAYIPDPDRPEPKPNIETVDTKLVTRNSEPVTHIPKHETRN